MYDISSRTLLHPAIRFAYGRLKFKTRSLPGHLKLMIFVASNEGTTEFPADYTLLKKRRKTCVC